MRGAERFRRVAAVLLSFAMIFGLMPQDAFMQTAMASETETADNISFNAVSDEATTDEDGVGSVDTDDPEGLSGSGTEEDPYILKDGSDWAIFASNINQGIGSDAFYKLSNSFDNSDVPINDSTMIGTAEHPFRGTFNGNFRTLSINIVNDSSYYQKKNHFAPFRYICGATIMNTKTDGDVRFCAEYMGGLVGCALKGEGEHATRGNRIEGCLIDTNITCVGYTDICNIGGVIGDTTDSKVTIIDTAYTGTLSNYYYDRAGGVLGHYDQNAELSMNNFLFDGEYISRRDDNFHPIGIMIPDTKINTDLQLTASTVAPFFCDSSEGISAFLNATRSKPDDGLYLRSIIPGYDIDFYSPVRIGGLMSWYPYTGEDISIVPIPYLDDGTELQKDKDYSVGFSDEEIKDKGDYELTIYPRGRYSGKSNYRFAVSDHCFVDPKYPDWVDGGIYDVKDTVTYSERIVVNGNVYLNLSDGAELHALKGICVNEGNSLTISGNGKLIADAPDEYAGIGSDPDTVPGDITINAGTVSVNGGKFAAGIGSGARADAGNITINGGTIFARGGDCAAGIGGGGSNDNNCNSGKGGNIVITGGDISAYGGLDAPGIGGGSRSEGAAPGWLYGADGGKLSILGGKIKARRGELSNTDRELADIGYGISPAYTHVGDKIELQIGLTDTGDLIDARTIKAKDIVLLNRHIFMLDGEDKGEIAPADLSDKNNGYLIVKMDTHDLDKGSVEDIDSYYLYTGDVISVDYKIMNSGGEELTEGVDYDTVLKRGSNVTDEIRQEGEYTLTFTGKGDYIGSLSADFTVGNGVPLTSTLEHWEDGMIYRLTEDITIEPRIAVRGKAKLILVSGNKLTLPNGISVPDGKTLIIDGEGSLEAYGSSGCAGIGGSWGSSAGTIIINDGNIKAVGNDRCAGIGGSQSGGTIIITGGTVDAQGGTSGAGIGGGGYYGSSEPGGDMGDIRILGGKVKARGGAQGLSLSTPPGYDIGPGRSDRAGSGAPFLDGKRMPIVLGWSEEGDYIDVRTIEASDFEIRGTIRYQKDGVDMGPVTRENLADKNPDYILCSVEKYNLESAVVTGIEPFYQNTGEDLDLEYSITDSSGHDLTIGTDYEVTGLSDEHKEQGVYYLRFTGKGKYTGTKTVIFSILDGQGIPADPFIIKNKDDWEMFAENIMNDHFADACYRLDENFDNTNDPATVSFGDKDHPFKGEFDGGGRTLTVDIKSSSTSGIGPFGAIEGATIKNLDVKGRVEGNTYAAGLAGICLGRINTIDNCRIMTQINTLTGATAYNGGVIGYADSADIVFEDTVFSGFISYTRGSFGGFVGNCSNSDVNLTFRRCLFKGKVNSLGMSLIADAMGLNEEGGNVTSVLDDAYYSATWLKATTSGTNVADATEVTLNNPPDNTLYSTFEASDGTICYVKTDISGIASVYQYTGSNINVTPIVMPAYGPPLKKDSDYTLSFSQDNEAVSAVNANGEYTVTLTGCGDYGGSVNISFEVGENPSFITVTPETKEWADGKTYVADGNVTFGDESDRIVVKGNVKLILNKDCYLKVPCGITVPTGTSLTIYGEGTLEAGAVDNNIRAAIGGGDVDEGNHQQSDAGTIIINGGKIIARAHENGAGIGSSAAGHDYHLIINAGEVEAYGSQTAPAIGGGAACYNGLLEINGGKVTAVTDEGSRAAAIGSGEYGNVGKIIINGGEISASSDKGAAIGGGGSDDSIWGAGNAGNIVINGGRITASSRNGYGIGPGLNYKNSNKNGYAGDLTLKWSSPDDRILVSSVLAGSVAFRSRFRYRSGQTDCGDVTAENLPHKLSDWAIVPYIQDDISNAYILQEELLIPYTGNVISPSLKVYSASGWLLREGIDYSMAFSPSTVKDKGTYNITLKGLGLYTGTKDDLRLIVSDSESGTAEDPFIIKDTATWDLFAGYVNEGRLSDKCFRLSDDYIDDAQKPTTMYFGTADHPFTGVFDGNKKTIHVDIADTDNEGTAPFSYISGATIKDLGVEGSVLGSTYAAGLVGCPQGDGNIIDTCMVNTSVYVPNLGKDGTIGGVVGLVNENSGLTMKKTAFGGTLLNERDWIAGLIGYCKRGYSIVMDNCLYKGTCTRDHNYFHPIMISDSYLSNNATAKDVYYISCPVTPSVQRILVKGVPVYLDTPNDDLYRGFTAADGNEYYEHVDVNNISSTYVYTETPHDIIETLVTGSGRIMVPGTDYDKTVDPSPIMDVGEYNITFTGKGVLTGHATRSVALVKATLMDNIMRVNAGCGSLASFELTPYIRTGGSVSGPSVTDPDGIFKAMPYVSGTSIVVQMDNNTEKIGRSAVISLSVNGAGNYEDYDLLVKVTAVDCVHEHREKRNARTATCMEKGYTGDIYCTDCGRLIREGAFTAKNPENHVEERVYEIVQEPSEKTLNIGIRKVSCVCGELFGYETFTTDGSVVLEEDLKQINEDAGNYTDSVIISEKDTKDSDGNDIHETIVKVGNKEVQKVITDENGESTVETDLWISGLKESYSYTGAAVKPMPHVYDGMQLLTAGRDYTVSYKNNKNISNEKKKNGLATLTVKFKNNYKKTKPVVVSYKIIPATLGQAGEESADAVASDMMIAATGKRIKPVPVVSYTASGKTINKKNFVYTYSDADGKAIAGITDPGTYYVTASPKNGCFRSSSTAMITVVAKTDGPKLMSKASVKIKSFTYTGEAIIPGPDAYTVKIGKKKLVYGTDYEAEIIGQSTESGKVKVRIYAITGNPTGYIGEKIAYFTINKGRRLVAEGVGSAFTYSLHFDSPSLNGVLYLKGGSRPHVTVSDNGRTLTEGIDYTVSYSKNTKLTKGATAVASVKGKGRYKGTVKLKYAVIKQDLEYVLSNGGTAHVSDKVESKKGYKDPVVTVTDINGKKLKKGTDFVLEDYSYDENTRLVSVRIKGKGNYEGVTGPYTYRYLRPVENLGKVGAKAIKARTYTGFACKLTGREFEELLYTGSKNAPVYLVPGRDFDVSEIIYSNNIKSGTAMVTIKGKGNYGGTKTLKFKILPADRPYKGLLIGKTWK